MFSFSQSLGSSYIGVWDSFLQITVTVLDPTGSGPPPVGIFTVTCNAGGELRNRPAASAPSTAVSPPLAGNWGPSNLTIVSIVAEDPTNLDIVYGANDTLTINFNKDTNLAGFALDTVLSKQVVDSIFSFSASLGIAYSGRWVLRSKFVITAGNVTGSGPPAAGFFTLAVRSSAGLRNNPPQSAPSTAVSPPLQGNWGTIIPRIIDFVASGLNGVYSAGSSLTITFRPETNLARLPASGVTRVQLDRILAFSQSLGTDYTGAWLNSSVLIVTVVNATGSAPPIRGVLNVTCIPTAAFPIRNIDGISSGCFSSSQALRGDFGRSIIQIAISAAGDRNPIYGTGDAIIVRFSGETNRANLPTRLNRTQVDALFQFSQPLGLGYTGQWLSNSVLAVNITNGSGSAPPAVGVLTVSALASAQLRNLPPNSAPIDVTSTALTGDFGPNNISIAAIVASDPLNANSVFSVGDRVSIIFSEATNQGGFDSSPIPKTRLDAFISFSSSFGANYQGVWRSQSVLELTSISTVGAGPPVLGVFFLSINVSANIRNYPPASAPMFAVSPTLTGDFGPSPITILAFSAQDPTDLDNVFSKGDIITITFSQATNQAGLPTALTKQQVDGLLTFSQPLGASYVGDWISASVLLITAVNVTGSGPPNVGQTTVSVLASAGLRNVPPQCKATAVTSSPLAGNFGILYPHITALIAQDPTGQNSVYSFLDTITIVFSIPTNRAGRLIGEPISRSDLLQQFRFSQQLGNAFSGEWVAADRLVITIEGTAGASPPTIGGLVVTCRMDTGVLIKNEISTSRPCSTASPVLSGDFGPSSTVITSLVARDPSNVGGRYRVGDTVTINFNEATNQGGYPLSTQSGGILNKSAVDSLFQTSVSLGRNYTGKWTSSNQFVIEVADIAFAGPPLPGVFFVTVLKAGNLRNFPPACAPSVAKSPVLSGDFGPSNVSILSWVAGYPASVTSCQGYIAGNSMTIRFSENTTRAGLPRTGVTKSQVDSLLNFFYVIGADYTGAWPDDSTFVVNILDPAGATPPTVGSAVGSVRAIAGLRGLPPVTAGSFAVAPKMSGEFGPTNVRFTSLVASGQDSVFASGAVIDVAFNIPTNKAFLPDTGVTKAQLNQLFTFSMSLGLSYTGAWVSASLLRISIINGTRDSAVALPFPPYVSTLRNPASGLQLIVQRGGELRNLPPLCGASTDTSPFMTGDFGASRIGITKLLATTTAADSVYGKGDAVTVYFSEDTDQAGYAASDILTKAQILGLFEFSLDLGVDFTGKWVQPSLFTIFCQNASGASPPTIGGLVATVVLGSNIRNAPPQSAPMLPVASPSLTGSFGPSPISIIGFNALDPLDLSPTYHDGNSIAIILSEHPSWRKQRVYNGQPISKADIDAMLLFSQSLGSAYVGQWIVLSACPADIYTTQPPFDGPPCVGILITVTDITGATPPQIGVLRVRFLAEGDVRNDPPQSDVTTAQSPAAIGGTWGIPTPKIRFFTSAAPNNGATAYGAGVSFSLTFSEATNRAGLGTGYFTRSDVDSLLLFSQSIGADYRGKWDLSTVLKVDVLDATGATPPEIGVLTVMVLSNAGRLLLNSAQTSKPSTSRYTTDATGLYGVQGAFAAPSVRVIDLVAERSTLQDDSAWGPGDSILVRFDQVVNKACFQGCADTGLGMEYLSRLFVLSDLYWALAVPQLGASFTGVWLSDGSEPCIRCAVGTAGVCRRDRGVGEGLYTYLQSSPCAPLVGNSTVCPAGYSLCNSKALRITNLAPFTLARPPTINGFYLTASRGGNSSLTNYPAAAGATLDTSPALRGDFGPPCVAVAALVASDPAGIDGGYGPGLETVALNFNLDVSIGYSRVLGTTLDQAAVDGLVTFYCLPGVECSGLAQVYSGRWTATNQLTIYLNVSNDSFPFNAGADPRMVPWIGQFFIAVRNLTNLTNSPPACAPSAPVSPALSGSFGPSNVALVGLSVRDPLDFNDVYGDGDILTLTFSQDTDAAGRLDQPFTRAMVDGLVAFSRPIGVDYAGAWISRTVFEITILSVGGVAPIDGLKCCNGTFTARILSSAGLRQYPPTSSPTATCGGPQVCNRIGSPSSRYWGSCARLGQNLSAVCQRLEGNYGRPYPRIVSVVGQGPADGRTAYRAGVNITITFGEPTNMGACTAQDAADVGCNASAYGTCALLPLGRNLSAADCAAAKGTWLEGFGASRSACQLPLANSSAACVAAGGMWSTGLSPQQACADGSNASLAVCLLRNRSWWVFETRIPRSLLDRAFAFSDALGAGYEGRWLDVNLSCAIGATRLPCGQTLVIAVSDAAGAGPPEMDLFRVTADPTRGVAIRSASYVSPGSTTVSPAMTGALGPELVGIVTFDAGASQLPGAVSGLYQNGVTLSIGFSTYTNRGNLPYAGLSRQQVDGLLSFDKAIGSNYTASWSNCTLAPGKILQGCQRLVVYVINASGAAPPTVRGLVVFLNGSGSSSRLRNYPASSGPSSARSGAISGDWGPSPIAVGALVARNEGSSYSGFHHGSTILVQFTMDTDRGGANLDRLYNSSEVDVLFTFIPAKFALNYTGAWRDNQTFAITAYDSSPALSLPIPYIGAFNVRVLAAGAIRNYPPTCAPTAVLSPPLSGGFGPSTVYIRSIVASGHGGNDTAFADNNTITITFNRATSLGVSLARNLPKAQVDAVFNFSARLGTSYVGSWATNSTFVITVLNSTQPATAFWCEARPGCFNATACSACAALTAAAGCWKRMNDSSSPDRIVNLNTTDCSDCQSPLILPNQTFISNVGTNSCKLCPRPVFAWQLGGACQFRDNGGYDPPLLDIFTVSVKVAAGLREYPPLTEPSDGTDSTGLHPRAYLTGGFCPSPIAIDSLVASDAALYDSVFGAGDRITVTFNQATNMGGGNTSAALARAQVDALFAFSCPLGRDYTGRWLDPRTFRIEIVDPAGNGVPRIGQFHVQTLAGGNIRNVPAVCAQTVVSGNANSPIVALTNDFGPSGIYIQSFIASAYDDTAEVYRTGVTFTLTFSESTNRGRLPAAGVRKAQIDNLLGFVSDVHPARHPLGGDYVGAWSADNRTLAITLTAINASDLAAYGPPSVASAGPYFRVSVKGTGGLRNAVDQSAPTVIDAATLALASSGGPGFPGVSCDCCRLCGTCAVCEMSRCRSTIGPTGLLVDACDACCGGPRFCCRVLRGNYGRVVVVMSVVPRSLPAAGGRILISGKGFGPQASSNAVLVGGLACPLVRILVDETINQGNLTCISPGGVGPDMKPVQVTVADEISGRQVVAFCCSKAVGDSFAVTRDGVVFDPPEVSSVAPVSLAYTPDQRLTIFGTNFGSLSLFDAAGRYLGPLGSIPAAKYTRPMALVVMKGGGYLRCSMTDHVSDGAVVCHTPEMMAASASAIVDIAGQVSRPWLAGTTFQVLESPRYRFACPVEKSGRCYDCCEAECFAQYEFDDLPDLGDATAGLVGSTHCSQRCYEFCGFTSES